MLGKRELVPPLFVSYGVWTSAAERDIFADLVYADWLSLAA